MTKVEKPGAKGGSKGQLTLSSEPRTCSPHQSFGSPVHIMGPASLASLSKQPQRHPLQHPPLRSRMLPVSSACKHTLVLLLFDANLTAHTSQRAEEVGGGIRGSEGPGAPRLVHAVAAARGP